MKIYYFSGDICLTSPLHVGSGEIGEYIGSLVQRNSDGIPIIPGTSLCGLMATVARDCLRLAGTPIDELEEEPIFQSLFGSARETEEGLESGLVVLDAIQKSNKITTFVQDRTSIDRERGSAMENHLFSDEIVPLGTQFEFRCEFRQKVFVGYGKEQVIDPNVDINAEALKLLKDIIELMLGGWYMLGGKGGIGWGQFVIKNLVCFTFDRTDPDNVLAFAVNGYGSLKEKHTIPFNSLKTGKIYTRYQNEVLYSSHSPEMLVIEGILRPLEPIMVKAGYSTEAVTPGKSRKDPLSTLTGITLRPDKEICIDAAFCRDAHTLPYIPGSSIRGSLRSHGERMVRSIIYEKCKDENIDNNDAEDRSNAAAWDVSTTKEMGNKIMKEKVNRFDDINNRACIISRFFGFTALGGIVSFYDVFPINTGKFETGLKLLDHVAIDRFTGGAAKGKKFNARPFFPLYPDGVFPGNKELSDEKGDMKFRVVLRDFEKWHLGLMTLLINDLFFGRIKLGYGTKKGFGRVKLIANSIEIKGLTCNYGILEKLVDNPKDEIGGFLRISKKIRSGENFWVSKEGPFYHIVEESVKGFRTELLKWQYKPELAGGKT